MNPASLRIRRATVEDLAALKSLWISAGLPVEELENRLTEFQVVERDGVFAGALGVRIVRRHMLLHSEDYTDFAIADRARELFWERIQTLAANHGVFRVWTRESSPFWTHWGFLPTDAGMMARLPEEWRAPGGRWLTLELKNEDAISDALDNRLAGFMDSEKQKTACMAARARRMRKLVTVVFFMIGALCFAVAFYLMARRGSGRH